MLSGRRLAHLEHGDIRSAAELWTFLTVRGDYLGRRACGTRRHRWHQLLHALPCPHL